MINKSTIFSFHCQVQPTFRFVACLCASTCLSPRTNGQTEEKTKDLHKGNMYIYGRCLRLLLVNQFMYCMCFSSCLVVAWKPYVYTPALYCLPNNTTRHRRGRKGKAEGTKICRAKQNKTKICVQSKVKVNFSCHVTFAFFLFRRPSDISQIRAQHKRLICWLLDGWWFALGVREIAFISLMLLDNILTYI
jgi:hypothetical protein